MVPRWSILPVALVLLATSCTPPSPVRVGFLAGLTGPVSELGIGARRALDLAVTEINRAGGVKGHPLELLVLDDGNEPAQGLAAYQQFQREGVTAVIGPVASTVIGEVLPYLNEHRILTVSPTVSAASVSGQDDWFFRVITENRRMGETLGRYAVSQGMKEVAVLRETSNDAYTGPILEAFRQTTQASGVVVKPAIEFDLRRKPDYDSLAQRLGASSAYLLLANGFDSAQVGQKLAQAGHLGPLLASPWAMTPEVISLGGRQVERMVFVSIYDSQNLNPRWLAFREAYKNLYGQDPGFAAVYARDALSLLVLALEKAPSWEPESLRTTMKSLGEISGLQASFHLDSQGDVVRDLFLLTVREGRFVRQQP